MMEIAAYIIVLILICLTVFQVLLLLGLPLGKYAWGGYHEVLPAHMRLMSVITIVLYAVFAVIALSRAGVLEIITNDRILSLSTGVLTGFFYVGTIANLVSRSKDERIVMTPVNLVLALLFTVLLFGQ